MRVADLIKVLQNLDPQLKVVLPGMMGGVDDLTEPVVLEIVRDVYVRETWRGRHESLEKLHKLEKRYTRGDLKSGRGDLEKFFEKVQTKQFRVKADKVLFLRGRSHS
jgi:hypothetical protein